MVKNSRISLHLLVRNGAPTIRRMIEPLMGFIDELVFADTGSTDGTPDLLMDIAKENNLRVVGHNCSPEADPDNFFDDVETSFLPWEFMSNDRQMRYTGTKILKDWSKPRNIINNSCTGDYILKMDAEDVVVSPEKIEVVKKFLDLRKEIDFVACPYFVRKAVDPDLYDIEVYTRFWRNRSDIQFREMCHENVDYLRKLDGSNWIMTNDAFGVYDYRDGLLLGKSIHHRNFKVLLREFDRCLVFQADPSKHTYFYLADEALSVAPAFSISLLKELYRLSATLQTHGFTKTDSAWYYFLLGSAKEKVGLEIDALEDFANASSFTLFPRAALRIAMLHSKLKFPGWKERLSGALANCQEVMYPFGASALEREEAISRLKD